MQFMPTLTWGALIFMGLFQQTYANSMQGAAQDSDSPTSDSVASLSTTQTTVVTNGVGYNGGPIMLGPSSTYIIYYGGWSTTNPNAPPIIDNFVHNFGQSTWWNIMTTYYQQNTDNTRSNIKPNSLSFGKSVQIPYDTTLSNPKSLSGADINTIVTKQLAAGTFPYDTNAIYAVITSGDVHQIDPNASGGFCEGQGYCGWHTTAMIAGHQLQYLFVGDPSGGWCSLCGSLGTTPNGNAGADNIINTLSHELAETVTDPDGNEWGYTDATGEIADKCAWNFGPTYHVSNGAPANEHIGNNDYLIQQLWVNAYGGLCVPAYCGQLSDTLKAGCMTIQNTALISQNGVLRLTLQNDGNLVLYRGGLNKVIWASQTHRANGNFSLKLQMDGNLVLYDVNNNPIWSTSTYGKGDGQTHLVVQNDQNVVLYSATNQPLWNTNTFLSNNICVQNQDGNTLPVGCSITENTSLYSPNGNLRLTLQNDGNLVLYRGTNNQVEWASNTNRATGHFTLSMQTDGNLVLYDSNNNAIWASNTAGKGDGQNHLVVQNDQNIVIYSGSNQAVWATNTFQVNDIAVLAPELEQPFGSSPTNNNNKLLLIIIPTVIGISILILILLIYRYLQHKRSIQTISIIASNTSTMNNAHDESNPVVGV